MCVCIYPHVYAAALSTHGHTEKEKEEGENNSLSLTHTHTEQNEYEESANPEKRIYIYKQPETYLSPFNVHESVSDAVYFIVQSSPLPPPELEHVLRLASSSRTR